MLASAYFHNNTEIVLLHYLLLDKQAPVIIGRLHYAQTYKLLQIKTE